MRLRHKIEKASAAKQRKARKDSRKVRALSECDVGLSPLTQMQNPQWKSRLKKDPGIPNLFPFKEKLLEEAEEKKRRKAEETQRLRDAARTSTKVVSQQSEGQLEAEDDLMDEDDEFPEDEEDDTSDEMRDSSNPMAALLASAQARAASYSDNVLQGDLDSEDDEADEGVQISQPATTDYRSPDSSRRAFDKIFKQVLEAADVILYVLDARDPDGTRSREVERQVMTAASGEKRLIFVLNKIDLVPPMVLKGWLKHLRRSFPTIPLRASTPASNAQTFDHKQLTIKNTSETLLRALKSFSASKQFRRSISVGIIGYPNVGKSSVINALSSRLNKGNQSVACPTGAEAGVTTSLREVKVDSKLKILDSPGIVFPSSVDGDNKGSKQTRKAEHEARLVLLNALPPSQMSDPVPAIHLLLKRLSHSSTLYEGLLSHYGITAIGPFGDGDTVTDFLVQVARKRGRLGKGGVPNLSSAAMAVITDWRDGRIQGWVEPPVLQVTADVDMNGTAISNGGGVDQKEIVKEWAAEFKLEGLWGDDVADDGHDGMQVEP